MGDTNAFEEAQRQLEIDEVNEQVERALKVLPPDEDQLQGIRNNIEKLKANGNWATARFYETLLEKRGLQEG